MRNFNRVVYKYQLLQQSVTLMLDPQATVVHVEMQGECPTMWIEQFEEAQEHPRYRQLERTFVLVPTGRPIPKHAMHVGSFLMHELGLVFHVYEE